MPGTHSEHRLNGDNYYQLHFREEGNSDTNSASYELSLKSYLNSEAPLRGTYILFSGLRKWPASCNFAVRKVEYCYVKVVAIFKINFYWHIVASQCCVSFCCTARWISHTYMHTPSSWDFLPFRSPQSTVEFTELYSRFPFVVYFMLVSFSCSVLANSLWPHGLQHARLPCPPLYPRVCSNSCPWSRWCHPAISSSFAPFFSCPQSFPASGSFPRSQLFQQVSFSDQVAEVLELQLQYQSSQWILGVSFLRICWLDLQCQQCICVSPNLPVDSTCTPWSWQLGPASTHYSRGVPSSSIPLSASRRPHSMAGPRLSDEAKLLSDAAGVQEGMQEGLAWGVMRVQRKVKGQ